MKRIQATLIILATILTWIWVILPISNASWAQQAEDAEDLKNQPAQVALFVLYLNKYGYKSYQTIAREEEQILVYKVKAEKTKEVIEYAIVFLPKAKLLRIEAYNLADVPSDKKKLNLLYQKITELNSKRTLGKFCVDQEKKRVRYAYYRTVLGGICYADFKNTLSMIEFIVINDLKELRDLKS